MRRNIFADGLFGVVALSLTVAGVIKLWSALRAGGPELPGRMLPGAAAMGWGLFNLVEGVIDHHLLQDPPCPSRSGAARLGPGLSRPASCSCWAAGA